MKKMHKGLSLFSTVLMVSSSLLGITTLLTPGENGSVEATTTVHKDITIDGNQVDPYNRFKGFGTVTCNNTSRLLLDYKEEHPDEYWEIMNKLFHPETGAGLTHVKVELGADVNSSSGTEPATKRYDDEPANVLRGAGFQFAADAKKINPNITTEILRWGEPRFSWNGSGNKDYSSKYQWYKQTIDAVKAEYGFTIDYVGLSQNERAISGNGKNEWEWLVYFLQNIQKEPNYKTDYEKIKYVAADGYRDTQTIANTMMGNEFLRENIDVISCHYDIAGSNELTKLQKQLISEGKKPKEVWISEGIAPMINTRYRENMESNYQGVGGTTGIVDVASRIISAYTWTGAGENPLNAVSFDFQPAVASFYEGAAYNPKHLVSAYDPWSGFYEEDGGISAVRQIMNFVDQDDKSTEKDERWQYVTSACYADGTKGDGGVNVNTGDGNFLTLKDPETDDYTTFYANNTDQTRTYTVSTANLDGKEQATLHQWQTAGSTGGNYDENWLQHIGEITPEADGTYQVTVKPYSILTVTTLEKDVKKVSHKSDPVDLKEDTVLSLPYTDDFEYSEYKDDEKGRDYVERRGGTPRYTTDQNAAFEVVKKATKATDPTSYESRVDRAIPEASEHGNMLQQKITTSTIGAGWNVWGGTDGAEGSANPHTNIGDHRWTNYKASYDFLLDTESAQKEGRSNYALLGVRQVKAGGNDTQATYAMRVYTNGKYEVLKLGGVVLSGKIENFDASQWHNLAVEAKENTITGFLDGTEFVNYTDEESTMMSGRVSLGSGFYETLIDNLKVEPIEGYGYYSDKIDSAQGRIYENEELANKGMTEQDPIAYLGDWDYGQSGYGHFNRTLMTATTSNPVWSGVTVSHKDKGSQGELNKVYYEGEWGSNDGNAWGGTGKSMEITFKGTEVKIYGERNPSNGKGDIYVDGVKVDSVDWINNYAISGEVWSIDGLSDENHTVKIVSTEGYVSFIKAEITTTDKVLATKDLAPSTVVKVKDDESLIGDEENTVYAFRKNNDWGSQSTNCWANFNDDPYILVNFTGSGIDFKSNSGSTAYKFELDGEDVGNYGPGSGVIYSVRDLPEGKHTLKVSLGDNAKNDTYMDYRGVTIYHEPVTTESNQAMLFKFKGSGFYLFGSTADAKLRVTIDGEVVDEDARIYGKGERQTSYVLTGLKDKKHTAKIEVLGGKFTLDGIDFLHGASTVPEIDFTELKATIVEAETIQKGNFTDESFKELQTQLKTAKKVASKEKQATQSKVNQATTALKNAIGGLQEKASVADTKALDELIFEVEALSEADYTSETWELLQTALLAAKEVTANEAITQEEVDAAKTALQTAKDGLIEVEKIIEAESVTLDKTEVQTVQVSQTLQLTATVAPEATVDKTVTFAVANEKIATVDETGLVTALKNGTTKVTAATVNGKTATIKLRVVK